MHADPAAQLKLLALADLDKEIGRVAHAARTLPQHASIAELMKARQAVTDELVASGVDVEDLSVAVAKSEQDLGPVKQRLVREERRIADGTVSDAKVLRSLTEEVEQLKRRISDLEDAQLEVMGRLEDATAHRDRVAARKGEIDAKLREDVAARDEAVGQLRQDSQDLTQGRGPIAAQIPADLLKLYDKLRVSTGLGAAEFRAGRCGGCQLQATLADLELYRKAHPAEVVRCVECERILVRTANSGL